MIARHNRARIKKSERREDSTKLLLDFFNQLQGKVKELNIQISRHIQYQG